MITSISLNFSPVITMRGNPLFPAFVRTTAVPRSAPIPTEPNKKEGETLFSPPVGLLKRRSAKMPA